MAILSLKLCRKEVWSMKKKFFGSEWAERKTGREAKSCCGASAGLVSRRVGG